MYIILLYSKIVPYLHFFRSVYFTLLGILMPFLIIFLSDVSDREGERERGSTGYRVED